MIISRSGSLLTGVTLNPNNIWSGSAFEIMRGPTYVTLGVITAAVAANAGLLASQYMGSQLIAEEFIVPYRAPTVDGPSQPQIPGDMYLQMGGNAGERLVTTLRNPTGGTVTYAALALLTAAGGRGRRGR